MSHKSVDPFWYFELCVNVLEAFFTKEEPAKKKEPETLPEIVWQIGPDGYKRGR